MQESLTINSDLAITITVTSGKESLGLAVGECSGASREVLQEQSERWIRQQELELGISQATLVDLL